MTWTGPTLSIGWLVALVTGIAAMMLWGLGALPKEWALVVVAICSTRL